jgi:replicative DNA helicase
MMTDKSSIQQVLGGLILRPQLLSEVDKYSLSIADFSTRFEKYIFSAILGLYRQGATNIDAIHIANFLEADVVGKKVFEQNNGLEFIEDIKEFSSVENFAYYYNRLKKINLLRDLKKDGFDVSPFYCDDLTNPKADEINARFEELTAKEICDSIKGKLIHRESEYVRTGEVETQNAAAGMRDFVKEMNETIAVGPSLQGHIYSKVFDGAMKTALYIRSGSSGLGKTRQAVGDACHLAYPIRYNSMTRQWEQVGSCEKVLFIITEQTFPQIKKMILAYLSDISDSRFKLGHFTAEEEERLDKAISIMEQFSDNMIIVKIPNPTIELVKTLVRENCLTHDIGYVFYDYIFIGPALLGEFRGFSLRNDEVLLMFATALKDLAVELNVAMFTSTQVNASADDNKNIRNEASLAGGRSTINKADNGAIMARPTNEELEILQPISEAHGKTPNLVTDIFKARSGEWTQVRIWSVVNLGTMKKEDLFMTDSRFEEIPGFINEELYEVRNWDSEQQQAINAFVDYLNERN